MENDPHNDKKILALVAAFLGVLIPICAIYALYVFRRSKYFLSFVFLNKLGKILALSLYQ